MSQRDSGYARKVRDRYETPEWVTQALLPHLPDYISAIWEPACASGRMVRAIEAACPGVHVWRTDIEPVGGYSARRDFLTEDLLDDGLDVAFNGIDAIITNPPYDLATEFCDRALQLMERDRGVAAMLLRTDFDHARSRTHLFRDCPAFAKKLVLMRRIVWFTEADGKPKASPSFNHCWMIWDWKHEGPPTIGYAP